jgi:hypothetical protein
MKRQPALQAVIANVFDDALCSEAAKLDRF